MSRSFEGPGDSMDFDWENKLGPVDHSSPFAQISSSQPRLSSFKTNPPPASSQTFGRMTNPFLKNTAARPASADTNSPSKTALHPAPPHSSFFNPQIPRQTPAASSFRNPAFTTPQKRVEELASEMSGIEDSPGALTDISEMPADTPDFDRNEDHATVTPAKLNRSLFSKNRPGSPIRSQATGRGEIPRGTADYLRDKVRKRKRQVGDRDVGSVRPRLPHDSDESDSDWETKGQKSPKKRKAPGKGFVGNMVSMIHDHPNLPNILTEYTRLSINLVLVGIFIWTCWCAVSMIKADFDNATDLAKRELLATMEACSTSYNQNRCSPKAERMPALDAACEEWHRCFTQDVNSVKRTRITAESFADTINGFAGALQWKAWLLLLGAFFIAIIANNHVIGRAARHNHMAPAPMASQGSVPSLLSPSQDPNQAYIWAPINQTPRHIKRELFLANDGTDTDGSPGEGNQGLLTYHPQTPSRRSPSKGERGRSRTPWKKQTSPTKGYA